FRRSFAINTDQSADHGVGRWVWTTSKSALSKAAGRPSVSGVFAIFAATLRRAVGTPFTEVGPLAGSSAHRTDTGTPRLVSTSAISWATDSTPPMYGV